MSPKLRRDLSQIIPFGLIWIFGALIYSILEKGLLGDLPFYPVIGLPYDFKQNILFTTMYAGIAGLAIGYVEVRHLQKRFDYVTFLKKTAFKIVIYAGVMIFFLLATTFLNRLNDPRVSIGDAVLWNDLLTFVTSYSFWSTELYIAAALLVSLFYIEVSNYMGPNVLRGFLYGQYHQPKIEHRVFMFLDMRSSTSIAENLGHVRYFDLLKDYYEVISRPLIKYGAEIYQYVGDEMVLSWNVRKEKRSDDPVRCFYAMKDVLQSEKEHFMGFYGVAPSFKAGVHHGQVTGGEIGSLKKEILFTGDVLNTTARIQSLCNEKKEELLISGQLLAILELDSNFTSRGLGLIELRGKNEQIELYAITRKDN